MKVLKNMNFKLKTMEIILMYFDIYRVPLFGEIGLDFTLLGYSFLAKYPFRSLLRIGIFDGKIDKFDLLFIRLIK